ncbi:MAG: succinate dehydrogenase cytochrome b subunit [Planctomycetaceae bacterium]
MAFTGLALCGFLVAHLAGNLNLFMGEEAFNGYAEKLHSLGPLLALAETGLFATFLAHIGLAISTAALSRQARKRDYELKQSKQGVFILPQGGAATKMMATGLVILAYLILHIIDMKMNLRGFAGDDNKFALVKNVLSDPLTGAFYAVALVILGVHLSHGVSSAFQTLGISHRRWNGLIRMGGYAFAWLISLGFLSLVAWAWNAS